MLMNGVSVLVFDITLVDGEHDYEGKLQISIDGVSGFISGSDWTQKNSMVLLLV